MRNYKAVFSYHGKYFHGVAEQTSQDLDRIPTVIGKVRQVLETLTQQEIELAIAGRTDRGVHAVHQVMNFKVAEDTEIDASRLMYVLNHKLNPKIIFSEIGEVDSSFHARFSAKSRTYNYLINNNELDYFSSDFAWHIRNPLDIEAMSKAAELFIGEKDFSSVCKDSPDTRHNVREVFTSEFSTPSKLIKLDTSDLICYKISANAFCWQMVRSIVGVLAQVGRGKVSVGDVSQMLKGSEREFGSHLAPAHGLFLVDVQY